MPCSVKTVQPIIEILSPYDHSHIIIVFDEPTSLRNSRDGVLEDWPRTRGHLEDKILWPWPRLCAALALVSRRSGRKTLNF